MKRSLSDLGSTVAGAMGVVLLRVFQVLIAFYRYLISPLIGPSCRYHPSCSEYAQEALGRHGAYLGTALAIKRVCRCHPWQPGGYDPVP